MPVSEDYYPLGDLCLADHSVAISNPGCTFDEKTQSWSCHPAENRCPEKKRWAPEIPDVNQQCSFVNGQKHCTVTFLKDKCPTVSYDQNANIMRSPVGACDCSLWFADSACSDEGCAPPIFSRIEASTTTVFEGSKLGLKWPSTGFYCDKPTRTAYLLTGDLGDEGPADPHGDGILAYHHGAGKLEHAYSHSNGLLDDNVRDMLIGESYLWAVTLTGCQRLDLKTHRWAYFKVGHGKILTATAAFPMPGAEDFVLANLKAAEKVEIVGAIEDAAKNVCVRLPHTAYGWAKRSSFEIRDPADERTGDWPKYSLRGPVSIQPSENSVAQERWQLWGPSCPQWKPILPLVTSADNEWIKVSDDFGLVDASGIEPELEPFERH